MRPIPWNKAFRKKDGSLVNMEDIGGGGGGGLPPHTVEDAGKVLGVDDEGNLAWVIVSGGSNFANAVVEPEITIPSVNAEEVE